MVREFKKSRYIIAAIITLLVFSLGLMLGLFIESERVNYIQSQYQRQRIDYSSSQLRYNYLNSLYDEKACPALIQTLDQNLQELEQTRVRLVDYGKSDRLNKAELDLLKRQYTIEQLNYWLLVGQAKKICNDEMVRIIYFYSIDEECSRCGDQEFILTYIKKRLKEKMNVFAFDAHFEEEPMIGILKTQYNVTSYPTLIVEGEVLKDFTNMKTLMRNLCSRYTTHVPDCIDYG